MSHNLAPRSMSMQLSLVSCAWLMCATIAGAQEALVVANASFEEVTLSEGGRTQELPGWIHETADQEGSMNPDLLAFSAGVPDGENVAWADVGAFHQELNTFYEAGERYVLEVDVGDRADLPFAGFRIELAAGPISNPILLGSTSAPLPGDGAFTGTLLNVRVPAGHAAVGRPILIRLESLGSEATFDRVRLTRGGPLEVPAQFGSVQEAIDFALDGEEVVVGQGTWVGNLDLLGKAITLRSTQPRDPLVVAATILDANGSGAVLSLQSGEGRDSVLAGLTLTGAAAGGLVTIGTSPIVRDCVFVQNAANLGAGASLRGGRPWFRRCEFRNNTAAISGGAVSASGLGVVRFEACRFLSNQALSGGALAGLGNASLETLGCEFSDNTATQLGGAIYSTGDVTIVRSVLRANGGPSVTGGGIYHDGLLAGEDEAHLILDNSLLVGNLALRGGALALVGRSEDWVTSSTFHENTALVAGRSIHVAGQALVFLSNTILWGGSGAPTEIESIAPASDVVRYCLVQGGHPGVHVLHVPPRFRDPVAGDFRLMPQSPAIDAGDVFGLGSDPLDSNENGIEAEFAPLDLLGGARRRNVGFIPNTGYGPPPATDLGACEFEFENAAFR